MRKCGLTKQQKQFVLEKLKEAYRALFFAFTDMDNGLNGRGYSKDLDQLVKQLGNIHALYDEIEGYGDLDKDISHVYIEARKRSKLYGWSMETALANMMLVRDLPDWAKPQPDELNEAA